MGGEHDEIEPLTTAFAVDDRPPFQREREASDEQKRPHKPPKREPLTYGRLGSNLFDAPTPAETLSHAGLPRGWHRFDIPWLLSRAVLGESAPREALIELVWRVGHSKALLPFDERTRDAAIGAVVEKLLGFGMLGVGLAVHFDVRRAPAFLSWIVATLRNAAVDELRRKRPATVPDVVLITDEDGDELERSLSAKAERHDAEGRPIIPGASVSEPARDLDIKQRLARALAAVNEREREILLAIADGESPEEIAGRLNLSASRVRAIIAEARAKAREALSTDD